MTELLFWETTILRQPISVSAYAFMGFALGFHVSSCPSGWRELSILVGPFLLTLTSYGSHEQLR